MVKKKKTAAKVKKAAPKRKTAAKKPKAGKAVKKKVVAGKAKQAAKMPLESMLEKIGEVTHFFPHVNAAAIMVLKNSIKVGDEIYIKGHTTDFKEKIVSIQLDHAPIREGKKGQEIGLLVKSRVRIGDSVYRI